MSSPKPLNGSISWLTRLNITAHLPDLSEPFLQKPIKKLPKKPIVSDNVVEIASEPRIENGISQDVRIRT